MKHKVIIITFAIVLVAIMIISLSIGSEPISITKIAYAIYDAICSGETSNAIYKIIYSVRLPRILLSVLAGVSLSISGVIYQTILRNPLAEPFTLGVSSGATFGAALSIFISDAFLKMRLSLFPFSFCGGIITIIILSIVLIRRSISLFTLIFIGISVSYFFNALLTLLLSLLGDRSYEVLLWMFGSFVNPPSVVVFILYFISIIVMCIILICSHKSLDLFYLPDDVIITSGINLNFYRVFYLVISSITTIFTVSLCGIIGFVGLLVPHIARLIVGSAHKGLLILSGILGGILLLISDDIARSFMSVIFDYGQELPVGVITSLVGVPFFVYLLLRNRRNI